MATEIPTFYLESDSVRVSVTQVAGHMTAEFTLSDGRQISPYAPPLWEPDDYQDTPNLLRYLRGDFFCLPFGPQAEGPPHGDTANEEWFLTGLGMDSLNLCQTQSLGAEVKKVIRVQDGHTALYLDHQITGLQGDWSYGTHPILDFSELDDGEARIATSAFDFGSTYPGAFADESTGETQALKMDAPFTTLQEVALEGGAHTDLTRFPARDGYEDLVMVTSAPATPEQPFAWTAVVFRDYIWYALKNPQDFPSTLFWISNGGRPQAPWCGRHRQRMGIEDVCSHYCDSVDISRQSNLQVGGREIPLTRPFDGSLVSLRNIQAVAPAPAGFGLPTSIRPLDDDTVEIRSESGQCVQSSVDWQFIL